MILDIILIGAGVWGLVRLKLDENEGNFSFGMVVLYAVGTIVLTFVLVGIDSYIC